jgi:hypothetical protein
MSLTKGHAFRVGIETETANQIKRRATLFIIGMYLPIIPLVELSK